MKTKLSTHLNIFSTLPGLTALQYQLPFYVESDVTLLPSKILQPTTSYRTRRLYYSQAKICIRPYSTVEMPAENKKQKLQQYIV